MRSGALMTLVAVSLLAIVPVASADQLGGSPGSVSFSLNPNAPGYPSTTIAFGSCTLGSCAMGGGYVLLPNSDTSQEDLLGWSLQMTMPTVIIPSVNPVTGQVTTTPYSQFPTYGNPFAGIYGISMNGATSTLNIGDSGGDDVFGTVTWNSVIDPGGSAATLIGTFTVTSETWSTQPTTGPAGILESVFVGQFPNTGITVGSVDTLSLAVTSCTYGGAPVDCLSSDPTGSVTGFSIQQATPPVSTPEPKPLALLMFGLAACLVGHKCFSKELAARG